MDLLYATYKISPLPCSNKFKGSNIQCLTLPAVPAATSGAQWQWYLLKETFLVIVRQDSKRLGKFLDK